MLDHWFFQRLTEPLVLFGIAGQCMFMLRFVIQWFASERRGRSYIPTAFWYFSLAGGLMVLTYGVLDHDPVIMLGQSLGITIYLRNLWLIHSRRWRYRKRRSPAPAPATRAGAVRFGQTSP